MIQIFLEGKIDIKLIDDLIIELALDINKVILVNINGWTNISNEVYINKLKENTIKGGKNLVIIDADFDFGTRKIEVETMRKVNGTDFELFLIPNNNDIGCIENILLNIADPMHHKIFDCFDSYKKCIESLSVDYFPPDEKNKIYSFTQSLLNTTSPNEINFRDLKYWNLNHQYLDNLKKFLSQHIV